MPAADLFNSSLTFCGQKYHYTRDQIFNDLQRNCPTTHSRVRYALARELGRYLGEKFSNVKSVYVYGSTMQDTAVKTSDIDMLVLVEEKQPSLPRLVHLINEEILTQYRTLLDDHKLPIRRMLDVHIVDTADVSARRGYGTLIGSLHHPPTPIWHRGQS